jgi:hypothetical protein
MRGARLLWGLNQIHRLMSMGPEPSSDCNVACPSGSELPLLAHLRLRQMIVVETYNAMIDQVEPSLSLRLALSGCSRAYIIS